MKLAMFSIDHGPQRLGIVRGDDVLDVTSAGGPPSLMAALEAGPAGQQAIAAAARSAASLALAEVDLHAPIARPGKFLALGINYKAHQAEMSQRMPDFVFPTEQVWFNKQVTSINGPRSTIDLPRVSPALDYEGELAFVIGRRCRHVSREDASKVIAGYMLCNDVSVRDWQMATPTMTIGKSFDTHGPIGPWLTTADECGDPQDLQIQVTVNGELRQDFPTSDMVFTCAEMVAHLSKAMTLEPGDVLTTGTSTGVGALRQPPSFLTIGDVVRVSCTPLGYLENTVTAEPEPVALD